MIIDIHTHPQWDDPIPQMTRILSVADRAGVGRLVVLGGNLGFGYQPTPAQVTEINDLTMRLVERWPDRLTRTPGGFTIAPIIFWTLCC